MYGYQFKCGACEQDVSQAIEPELVIVPINGASESLQCCFKCARDIKAEIAALDNPTPPKPEPKFGRERPPNNDAYILANTIKYPDDKLDVMGNKIDQLIAGVAALVQVLTPKG